ncbi:MAG: HEAT repeat domain-containing protein [Chloroflexota bacterium]|nr:HEAT repeat domain-containing protein [Chloroflexota bacterium]
MSKEELNKYIALLKDDDPSARYWAALYLEGAPDKAAVPALIDVFSSEDAELKGAAAKALGSIGPDARDAVPILAEAAKSKDAWVSKCAEYALGKIKGR